MEKKKKIICISAVVVSVITAFLLGCFIGCNVCCNHKGKGKKTFKVKSINFYSVKKHIGEQITKDEKNAIKLFVDGFENCLEENLNENDKKDVEAIKKEVLELAKENTRIKIDIKDLKNKDAKDVIKKVRKCIKKSKKHMTKTDKRILNQGISKMKMEDIILMFHGIR